MSGLATLPSQFFTRRAASFSGTTLITYDFLITLPLEVKYIWNAPWTATKAGFLLNRYGNLIGQAFMVMEETGYANYRDPTKFCTAFGLFCGLFILFSGESIRILVLMRAWVIWGCTYRVTVLLITLYITYILAIIAAVVYPQTKTNQAKFTPHIYLEQVRVCVVPIIPHIWVTWLATLGIDTIVLGMVGYSLRKLVRESRDLYPSPLIHLLVQDAVLFYAVRHPNFWVTLISYQQTSLFNSVFSMICWSVFDQDPRNGLPLALSFPLLSVVGQRLILNLRGFQGRSFATRDISREVDRQMAAMGDLVWPEDLLEVEEDERAKEEDRSCNSNRTAGTTDSDLEATGIRLVGSTGLARIP